VVIISFEKKVLLEILNCSEVEFNNFQEFIKRFKERYNRNFYNKFIEIIKERDVLFYEGSKSVNLMRYYLLCEVVEEIESQQEELFWADFFDALIEIDYSDAIFRFGPSFFREIEGIEENLAKKLTKELNFFLEILRVKN